MLNPLNPETACTYIVVHSFVVILTLVVKSAVKSFVVYTLVRGLMCTGALFHVEMFSMELTMEWHG